jgi:CheY-like chemotaxis protein/two-component sensor histidine kinase
MLQKKPPAERRKWCEQIVGRQVDQLQRLVNDLIDISRITQGKIELQIETVEITEQMQHAVESIKTSTTQKNQHLWISTPSEPIFIEADPVRLQQIFTNLLKNASMYTPDGGGIWFSAHEEEDAVAVSCRDNGMGIRDDQVESIFKPFIEVNPYYKGSQGEYREGGLGIGLSLVKQLSELHGGAVQVISEGEGKGSEFILRLPKAGTLYKGKPFPTGTGETTPETGAAAPGATQSPSPVADTARPSSSHSILIVEDNQDFAALLRETLSDDGHEVLITDNGQDAIDKTLSEVPDYVIIDIGISDMDGYTIAEKLRESPGLEKTTLIALSGYNPDTSQPEHLFDHYIIKGSDIERLFSIINFP